MTWVHMVAFSQSQSMFWWLYKVICCDFWDNNSLLTLYNNMTHTAELHLKVISTFPASVLRITLLNGICCRRPPLTRARVCASMSCVCLIKKTIRVVHHCTLFIPSPTLGCVESAELCAVHLGWRRESLGASERPVLQRECLVSWTSPEAAAQDKDCCLRKYIIYSKAMGKFKSIATFRSYKLKWDILTTQPG